MALVCRNEARLVSLRNNWLEPEEPEDYKVEYFEREVTAEVLLEKKQVGNFEAFMCKHNAEVEEGEPYVYPDGEVAEVRYITLSYEEIVGYDTSSDKIRKLLTAFTKSGGDYADHNIVKVA